MKFKIFMWKLGLLPEYKCPVCGSKEFEPELRVLDTWFDSGSMPYAQMHYPFENKEKFEKNIVVDFVSGNEEENNTTTFLQNSTEKISNISQESPSIEISEMEDMLKFW